MKIFLILFLLSLYTLGFSQLVEMNRRWNVLETEMTACKGVNCMGSTYFSTHSYHLGKDTVIDLKNYSVLIDTIYRDGYQTADTTGFIREEKKSNRVFFLSKYASTEKLLYDFSLQLDEEFIVMRDWDSNVFKVTALDSVDYYEVKRLTITLTDENMRTMQWIEGLGSVQGLLYTQFYESLLLCAYDYEHLIYKNTLDYPCIKTGIIDAINDIEDSNSVQVYPNPVSEYVNIKSN